MEVAFTPRTDIGGTYIAATSAGQQLHVLASIQHILLRQPDVQCMVHTVHLHYALVTAASTGMCCGFPIKVQMPHSYDVGKQEVAPINTYHGALGYQTTPTKQVK